MSKVKVQCFSLSIDGFGAGPGQSLEHPIGVGGLEMMEWMRSTQTFQKMYGKGEGETGVNDELARRSFVDIGAWILGRNMFGPIRGPWSNEDWKGWWGTNPPYHVPVFVLTHHARKSIEMEGGTIFHFVTEGIHVALDRAHKAAGEKDVRLGGGVATIRQYLQAGLVDELHLAIAPVLLGSGEHLLGGIDLKQLGYECSEHVATERATHVVLQKR